ncbi:hypothetical protein HYW18_02315 [Candidatus Uhrbacteria bacterium]|nr:hypothetical protein [Candidatus Uhrbacteria bacterium]
MNEELRSLKQRILVLAVLGLGLGILLIGFIWKTRADEDAIVAELGWRTGPISTFPRAAGGDIVSLQSQIIALADRTAELEKRHALTTDQADVLSHIPAGRLHQLEGILKSYEEDGGDLDRDGGPDATTDVSETLKERGLVAFLGYRRTPHGVRSYWVGTLSPTGEPRLHIIMCTPVANGKPLSESPKDGAPPASVRPCFVTDALPDPDPTGG